MFGRLLGWYTVYTFSGALAPDGILAGAKFTFRPTLSLPFSYICSITARQSSSGRQPNFVAFSRGRHLYSAGRPSLWPSAHVLILILLCSKFAAKSIGERILKIDQNLAKFEAKHSGSFSRHGKYAFLCQI